MFFNTDPMKLAPGPTSTMCTRSGSTIWIDFQTGAQDLVVRQWISASGCTSLICRIEGISITAALISNNSIRSILQIGDALDERASNERTSDVPAQRAAPR